MRRFSSVTYFFLILIFNKVESFDSNSYRLPHTVQPLKYNLTIEPVLTSTSTNSVFFGSVSIEFIVIENTDNITLNVRELNINKTRVCVTSSKSCNIDINDTVVDEKHEFYIIALNDTLEQGEKYDLEIDFSGYLSFDKEGFYLAEYNDFNGNERLLAVTDFQPSGARKAFPCFDEPALKANFLINVIRSKQYISASNEELEFTKYLGNDRFQDTYKQTVKMSTYLVAFAVCDYNYTIKSGKHRILTKQEAINTGKVDYMLSISGKLMEVLENYTEISYTLNKLDEFSVPSEYFIPGGMENWGLITISEDNLFCGNSSMTTTSHLQKCTTFATHEFSHQWFGNLVTPSWWRYLWLSEGLATYLEYYITSILTPSWELMDQFVLQVQQKVFEYDGGKIQRALNSEPVAPGILPSSVISYYKGACIIRMMEHFLSHEVFKTGVRNYLRHNQFGVVEPSNLYEELQKSLNESNLGYLLENLTVTDVLSTWDSTSGYPLISVTRDYENDCVTLLQNSFFPNNIASFGHVWYVPINFVLQYSNKTNENEYEFSKTTADYWLTEKLLKIHQFPSSGWILVNKLQTGYYRVNYDITNWERLSKFLLNEDFNAIHITNRAQLIDDAFNLAKRGYIPYEVPLNLSKYLVRETDYVPLASFLHNIESLNTALALTNFYNIFQNYIISVLNSAYRYLGFEEKMTDSHLDKLNRINILSWLCRMGHQGCRTIALKKFREWKSNNETQITADMEVPIFCGAMQIGNADDWDFLYTRYQLTIEKNQRARIFASLGCTRNETILEKFLGVIIEPNSNLSFHMQKTAFEKLTQTSVQRIKVSLDYLISHISEMQLTDSRFTTRSTEILCKYLTPMEVMNHLNKTDASTRSNTIITNCLFHAERNQEWYKNGYIEQISKWLLDYKQ